MARPKKKELTRKQLIRKVKENKAKINKRIARIIREEPKNEFVENQLNKFRVMTGTKSKTKVATGNVSKFSKKKISDIYAQQQAFLKSKHSTLKGRKEIKSKQRKTLAAKGYDLNKKQFNLFTKMMNDRTLNELREQKLLDSWQMLEISQEAKKKNVSDIKEALDIILKNFAYREMEGYEIRDAVISIMSGDDDELAKLGLKHGIRNVVPYNG